MNQSESNQ